MVVNNIYNSTTELQNILSIDWIAKYSFNLWIEWKELFKMAQLVRTFLKWKGKLSHLLVTGPKPEDPIFNVWDGENSMLWNSMLPEISYTCMFLGTAKRHGKSFNRPNQRLMMMLKFMRFRQKSLSAKQGSCSITEYSNFPKGWWQKIWPLSVYSDEV